MVKKVEDKQGKVRKAEVKEAKKDSKNVKFGTKLEDKKFGEKLQPKFGG